MSSPDSHGVPLDSTLGPGRVNDFVPQQLRVAASYFSPLDIGGQSAGLLQRQISQFWNCNSCNEHKWHNLHESTSRKVLKYWFPALLQEQPKTSHHLSLHVSLKPSSSRYYPSGTAPSLFPLNGPSSQKLPLNLPHPSV